MKKSPRKRIAAAVETDVLTLSRRRCCACFFLEGDLLVKSGQIAHLDRNPANNELDNLAYLCLDHHDSYDTTRSQSKGITVGELKYYRTELYRILGTDNRSSSSRPALEKGQIRLSESVHQDCTVLRVSADDLVTFILNEANRHPLLFGAPFMSLPLVFRDNVLLISWDFNEVRVERLLNRQEAYPLNDPWTSCLALYRKATLLPYRSKAPGDVVTRTEGQRAISTYRKLIAETSDFIHLVKKGEQDSPQSISELNALVDEAEFALANGEDGKVVTRLEAVLSSIHKLILNYAPQGTGTIASNAAVIKPPVIDIPTDDKRSILIVDDMTLWLESMRDLLLQNGYAVTIASTTTAGLQALVEHEFDLVITDLVMCADFGDMPEADGREIVLAAKKSSAKTKVIVVTGFLVMSHMAELFRAGIEDLIDKASFDTDDFLERIRKYLNVSESA